LLARPVITRDQEKTGQKQRRQFDLREFLFAVRKKEEKHTWVCE
jgi:hypothetical protein